MRLVEQFFRVLAPSNCIKCGNEGSLICIWCIEEALPAVVDRCYRCNKLSGDSRTCPACRRHTVINHLWVRTEYSEYARQVVHAMKFRYSNEAAELIARELKSTIPVLAKETLIIHVPTITNHIRQRGFDHSRVIARHLSRLNKLEHLSALLRLGQARQVGASRLERIAHVQYSFEMRQTINLKGARVLLVDDVITTGATLEAAARVLRQAGAIRIDAVVFAQAK